MFRSLKVYFCQEEHNFPPFLYSGVCVGVVLAQTLFIFHQHFSKWTLPHLQIIYLRISLLPLVFSLLAFISLFHPHTYSFLDALRHIYEGYTLYAFASLMILHSGGDEEVEDAFTRVRDDTSLRLIYGNPFRFPCCELYHFEDSGTTLRCHSEE